MLLETDDIEFKGLPADVQLDAETVAKLRFEVRCPKCEHASKARGSFLGKKVRCPKCEHDFVADWGEPVAGESR